MASYVHLRDIGKSREDAKGVWRFSAIEKRNTEEKRRKEKVYCRYQLSLILHGNKSPQQRYRSISHPRPSLLSSTHFATTPWPVCAGRNRPFREYRYSMFAVFWLPPCGIITVFLKQKERGREKGGKKRGDRRGGEKAKRRSLSGTLVLPQKRRIKLPHVDAWCPGPVECLRFFARPLAVWNVSIRCKPSADFEDDSDGNRRIRSAPPLSSFALLGRNSHYFQHFDSPPTYFFRLLYWIRLELFETLEFFIFVDIF